MNNFVKLILIMFIMIIPVSGVNATPDTEWLTEMYAEVISFHVSGDIGTKVVYPMDSDTYSVDEWYSTYVDRALNINERIAPKHIIPFTEYVKVSEYWSKWIGKKYLYMIINEALIQEVPIKYIFAIAVRESIWFRYFESMQANDNGSMDYGIMGLNSKNIESDKFLDIYFRYDSTVEEFDMYDQTHIIKVCTRYLKDLLKDTGTFRDAAICYNGGYRRWASRKAPKAAIVYGNAVDKIQKMYSKGEYIPKRKYLTSEVKGMYSLAQLIVSSKPVNVSVIRAPIHHISITLMAKVSSMYYITEDSLYDIIMSKLDSCISEDHVLWEFSDNMDYVILKST